jgi:hypothetical protein
MMESIDVPVADLLMDFLRSGQSGKELFVFVEQGYAAVEIVLDTIFALPSDPNASIDALIRLSCALEGELRSPTAASTIRAVMSRDPRVIACISSQAVDQPELRRLERFRGERSVKSAPMYGARSPEGTLKAGTLAAEHDRSIARERTASILKP